MARKAAVCAVRNPNPLHDGQVTTTNKLTWRPAPGWPECPPGWTPPPGWSPPADWPPAPADWEFWTLSESAAPAGPAKHVELAEQTRDGLVLETRLVMIAGLLPWIASAVVILGTHLATGRQLTQLPTFTPHQPVLNTVLGLLSYMPVAVVAPLALLLLARTGQPPSSLGLTNLRWPDLWVAVGIAAAAFGLELVLAVLIVNPLHNSRLVNSTGHLHVPTYYLILGVSQALLTAVAEEVIVNGYLITRLSQFGWSPAAAFWLSMALRASYHIYYGIAFVLTLPFGWLVTRSFQKHGKLTRPILAHFLFDAGVFTFAILVGAHR